MQEPIFRIVNATVKEASQAIRKVGNEERLLWNLKLEVPNMSRYPMPCSMPVEWADRVIQGESVRVKLRRGRIAKEENDGSKDYHFFWEIEEWNTSDQAPPPATGGGESHDTSLPVGANDPRFRTKQELRWTEAWHIAARLAPFWELKDFGAMAGVAQETYKYLEDCPKEEAPVEASVEAPAATQGEQDWERAGLFVEPPSTEPGWCEEHQVYFEKRSANTQKVYHIYQAPDGERYYCVEGEGLLPGTIGKAQGTK